MPRQGRRHNETINRANACTTDTPQSLELG